MTAKRPVFKVVKNGYDRFAVDDAITDYTEQINQLQHKLDLYQQQLVETTRQLDEVKHEYDNAKEKLEKKDETADTISRLALREANDIISTARKNADTILLESLTSARLILTDLSRLYQDAGNVKSDMSRQLEKLIQELDEFRLPQMPDLKWIDEAEKKMQ